MKALGFWILDASVLFSLSLLYLHQGFHRKNHWFTVWLFSGVVMQLIAAWGLAAGWPHWMGHIRAVLDAVVYLITIITLVTAIAHRDCVVNRSVLWGLGSMVALNVFARLISGSVDWAVQVWLRNIAFFGPAIFLLIAFSNLRLDRLPLWINSTIDLVSNRVMEEPALAAVSVSEERPIREGWRGDMQSVRRGQPTPPGGMTLASLATPQVHDRPRPPRP